MRSISFDDLKVGDKIISLITGTIFTVKFIELPFVVLIYPGGHVQAKKAKEVIKEYKLPSKEFINSLKDPHTNILEYEDV